ncbi:MAG TPA: hypothetical protein VJO33_18540 [Gemmatimonadaceae bacterium]|nr:hypothetical protein [Gemmatimonadaceae bacterium]
MVNVRPLHPRAPFDSRQRVGDLVAEVARRYAAQMNGCEFATLLRSRRLDRRRYIAFIASLYPCVIGFNRALIRSIAKVDHVMHSGFIKSLAEQLHEEQTHNQMWRTKLDIFEVDHQALYWTLTDYMGRFSTAELERMTRDVLAAIAKDPNEYAPGAFPEAPFPEPILALYHQLFMTATYEDIDYWEHFASQSAIEMTIYSVVSTTVLPGVQAHPELDGGPATLRWWTEHAKAEGSALRTDEEKHLDMSRVALNRSETANSLKDVVVARAEDALRLFAAAMACQITESERFPLDRYLATRAQERTGTR